MTPHDCNVCRDMGYVCGECGHADGDCTCHDGPELVACACTLRRRAEAKARR